MPRGFGMLEERRGVRDAGVGEHHVEASVLGDDAIDESLHLAGVTHVHAHREGAPTAAADFFGDEVGAGGVDVADRDRRALGGEQPRRRAPDAGRATRVRRHPSLQPHGAASILACPRSREATMNAIVFAQTGRPEVLTLAEVPKPDARPGMVLIRVHAIGVNFADTRFRQGTYVVKPKLPDTPGMEAAGVVEAVGEGVSDVRPGMRVAAFTVKSYADYCQAPASMVLPLPDFVSDVEGAAFPIQVLTAYHLLHTADATGPGRTVLVHSAAGGVGLAAPRRGPHPRRGGEADVRGGPALPGVLRASRSLRPRRRTDRAARRRPAVREVAEGQRLHAADGDAELPRQDARERRALLRAPARRPADAAHRQDVRPRRRGGGASLPRIAAVDGQAHPDPVSRDHPHPQRSAP